MKSLEIHQSNFGRSATFNVHRKSFWVYNYCSSCRPPFRHCPQKLTRYCGKSPIKRRKGSTYCIKKESNGISREFLEQGSASPPPCDCTCRLHTLIKSFFKLNLPLRVRFVLLLCSAPSFFQRARRKLATLRI